MQGYPTVKLISGRSSSDLTAVEFQGDRSAKSIIDWAFREAKKLSLKRIGAKTGSSKGSAFVEALVLCILNISFQAHLGDSDSEVLT